MVAALIEVTAAVLVTAATMLLPGAMLLTVLGAWPRLAPLLRPAAAVLGTVLLASGALAATLALQRSIDTFMAMLAGATLALAIAALLAWRPRPGHARWRGRLRRAVPYAVPGALLAAVAALDAPHVRSDTYWHVALARRLADLPELSSAAIAFEAGAAGNANYPLPSWHALIAAADAAPRVDAWSATWFATIWLAPVAMLAFGGMASALVGDRRAAVAGCWTFLAVVVLGYGPWYFASRYLSYPGQVAIYLMLPLVVTALVRAAAAPRGPRARELLVAAGATAAIGVLHGNYVLYPVLFAIGGAVLLLLGARPAWKPALVGAAAVSAAGIAAVAAQLRWIRRDDNFLRGTGDPTGEPSAFVRHRDAFTGSEESHHVALGLLASQPLLVLGALAIPAALLLVRRRPGPWYLAGGALAIVAFARSPQLVGLLDRLGSVTPATRFDRVYPAAVGVAAAAFGAGALLERSWRSGVARGAAAALAATLAAAGAAWALDLVRDTRRIVVTPFVEARWVGGLDPHAAPLVAVWIASIATVGVAVWLRLRDREDWFERHPEESSGEHRGALAALLLAGVAVGLLPATVDRLRATWEPQAYVQAARQDASFVRIEVYPAAARAAILELPPGATVLAGFNDVRRIASLAPVRSIEESRLRELVADPPAPGSEARRVLAELVAEWDADYVAASTFDPTFRPLLDAAEADPRRYQPIDAGPLRMFRVRRSNGEGAPGRRR